MQNQLYMNWLVTKRTLQLLRQPIDRTAWIYPPVIVNAFYDPSFNDICKTDSLIIIKKSYLRLFLGFPAGILKLPFFDKDVPK